MTLKQAVREEARRLGFALAGVTTPEPPAHITTYEGWLAAGHHADMHYLANERACARRADPRLILPECQSILVLAIPYSPPLPPHALSAREKGIGMRASGKIAAYAWGQDYHLVIPPKLQALVEFIEAKAGRPILHRYYTDTGPVLERDLAQRAGLGWIGKNTCLIHPKGGSYFFLAEILLDLQLAPDAPFQADYCGTCTRCIQACPTHCILPNRTLDARRCLSYLTIENKGDIPPALRPKLDDWVFGCDICQTVCPWNRFALRDVDASFAPRPATAQPDLLSALALSPADFNRTFKGTPLERAKRRGYLRNVAVALGNVAGAEALPALRIALNDPEPLVRTHAAWAITQIEAKQPLPDETPTPLHLSQSP
ncbi:MAG: tRNA epoxyqueuosine(34) reductase QueG [Anaerolineales bacterium]